MNTETVRGFFLKIKRKKNPIETFKMNLLNLLLLLLSVNSIYLRFQFICMAISCACVTIFWYDK